MATIKIKDTDRMVTINISKEEETEMAITNIKEFAEVIANRITEVSEHYEAEVFEVVKFNDEKLYGVRVKERGSKVGAGPVFYLESAYEDYENGASINGIVAALIDHADSLPPMPMAPADIEDLSFDAVKDKLSFRVLEVARNEEFLDDKPYKADNFGTGLGMIVDIHFNDEYRATVNYNLMEKFEDEGHYGAEVIKTALENAKKIDPPKFSDMGSALFGGSERNLLDEDDFEWEDDGGMFVLSTESGMFGASALFYPGILDRISEMFGVGLFILPSSVHEVIILPDTGAHNPEMLKQLVRQANRTVVEPNEVLSDNVFYFSYAENNLSIAA